MRATVVGVAAFLDSVLESLAHLCKNTLKKHGTRFILTEFAIGIVLPLILGFSSIRAGLFSAVQAGREIIIGLWLLSVAINYLPLFIYGVLIARSGTLKEEGQPELAHVKRYSLQQVIIFIPFLVVVLAIIHESRRRTS